MPAQKTCLVEAPSDVPEGYLFDATVDGITFSVTVPKGGVTRGQMFEVPYPTADLPTAEALPIPTVDTRGSSTHLPVVHKTTVKRPDGTTEVIKETRNADGSMTTATERVPGEGSLKPTQQTASYNTSATMGRWKTELCGCCDVCCSGVWWMGCCCQPILLGQIIQRMGLTICGCPGNERAENTCAIITALWLISLICTFVIIALTDAGILVLYAFFFFFLVATTGTRMEMRRRYRIPSSCCDGCCDDCCHAYWCSCCVAIQMHRQTHNEHEYPYSCGSKTGLPFHAPAIV